MIRKQLAVGLIALLWTFAGITPVLAGQDQSQIFDDWLEERMRAALAARLTQAAGARQAQAPSMSANSTSLLDQSSASDLFSIAGNLVDLNSETDADDTTTSATVSTYALYTWAKGLNQLDPEVYNAGSGLRRVWFTLGIDTEEDDDGESTRVNAYGLKLLVFDQRDASSRTSAIIATELNNLVTAAGAAYGRMLEEALDYLHRRFGGDMDLADFVEASTDDPEGFAALRERFDDRDLAALDNIIAQQLATFYALDEAARDAVDEVRNAAQVSVSIAVRDRDQGPDEQSLGLVADLGLGAGKALTLNAAYERKDGQPSAATDMTDPPDEATADAIDMTAATSGGRFAAEVTFDLTDRNLADLSIPTLSVAGQGAWMSGETGAYKAQVKFTLPLGKGVELPASITWSNRLELIEEENIRGQFGITLDLAKLLAK